MNTYEQKQQARLERYERLVNKAKQESKEAYQQSNKIVSVIPPGQPILVGHHSEKHHRATLKKCHRAMDRSVNLQAKAEYYENKIEGIKNNNAISSDDPEAIEKLKCKLKKLESQRENIKEHNRKARQEGRKDDVHPGWLLSNLGNNIRTVKQRIQRLEKTRSQKTTEIQVGNIKIIKNVEDNRVQIFFPDKPNETTRTNLKRNGFRWSKYNGCWQRHLNNMSEYLAKQIVNKDKGDCN